jgi:hypothetical protein
MGKRRRIKPPAVEGEVIIARVAIYRVLCADGSIHDDVYADDNHDGDLDWLTAMSMCDDAARLLSRERDREREGSD